MKHIKRIVFVLILISCSNVTNFNTVAIYSAENSSITVNLRSKVIILKGDDLGEGETIGRISSPKFSDTIYFKTNPKQLLELIYKKDTIEVISPNDFALSLAYSLNKIGYTDYDENELNELGNVIQATAYGPKATYMQGQTNVIKVIKVDFNWD